MKKKGHSLIKDWKTQQAGNKSKHSHDDKEEEGKSHVTDRTKEAEKEKNWGNFNVEIPAEV